ncbi:hypothetical protein ABZ682_22835 [Streptomyces griseoviridis]|uniref:hypothetical protein n=1 Tax=Streptomyces griseoviridis TaxID=45398 RepID=UPI0033EBDE02
MVVDLSKAFSPQQPPQPDGEPQPAPEPVEKETVALTPREELVLPLKALGGAIVAGSPPLAHWIGLMVWRAVREVSRTQESGPVKKDDEAADGQKETAGFGDLAERVARGAFCVAIVCAFLTGGLRAAWPYIAPYSRWIAVAVVVGWCLAAAAFAPDEDADTIENDHEKLAGENPQEDTPEEVDEERQQQKGEPWPVARDRLLRFVEERVASGAGGHNSKVKGKGARLDDLLAELQENNALQSMDRKGFMVLLDTADIPYREQMKFRVFEETGAGAEWKQKNVPGVHADDLAKHLGRPPRLPACLVPSFGPEGTPISPPDSTLTSAPESVAIPTARTPGE